MKNLQFAVRCLAIGLCFVLLFLFILPFLLCAYGALDMDFWQGCIAICGITICGLVIGFATFVD